MIRPSGMLLRRALLLAPLAVALLVFAVPVPKAQAHSLDQYLVASYVTVRASDVSVELDLSPGVLVSPPVLALIDTSADSAISAAEADAYVAAVLDQVTLTVDGKPVALEVESIEVPEYALLSAGYGAITVTAFGTLTTAAVSLGDHLLEYTSTYSTTGAVHQINVLLDSTAPVVLGTPHRDDDQMRLSLDYTVGSAPSTRAAATSADAPLTSGAQQSLLGFLNGDATVPWAPLLALLLAAALGGLHAMTPGHGKTLAAAYLVGSRGTVRNAAVLGVAMTGTHIASVIVIGLLAVAGSQLIVPNVLVPILTVVSGLLVVGLGARLLWRRVAELTRRRPAGSADLDLAHDAEKHPHGHELHARGPTHAGDVRAHTHNVPGGNPSLASLLALAVSGGIVPCPEALGILVIAVGLNQILFGLGLIVAFSLGLASVLIGIGILLVRARLLVDRMGVAGPRLVRYLPVASAAIVTVLGAGIVITGVAAYV